MPGPAALTLHTAAVPSGRKGRVGPNQGSGGGGVESAERQNEPWGHLATLWGSPLHSAGGRTDAECRTDTCCVSLSQPEWSFSANRPHLCPPPALATCKDRVLQKVRLTQYQVSRQSPVHTQAP